MRTGFVFAFVFLIFLSNAVISVRAQHVIVRTACQPVAADPNAADYVPGIDGAGRSVIPADLNSVLRSATKTGHGAAVYPLDIPIEIDVLTWLGITETEQGAKNLEAPVALLKLHKDGRLEYNGQDVSGQISHQCFEDVDKPVDHELPSKIGNSKPVSGQEEEPAVKSPEVSPPEQTNKDEPLGEILEGQAE